MANDVNAIVAPPAIDEQSPEVVKAPEAKPVDPNNERLLTLARKEKALRARERQIQEREAKLQAPAQPQAPKQPEWQERLKKDLIGMAAEAGMSRDDIANMLLSQQGPSTDYQLEQLKQKLELLEKTTTDVVSRTEQQQKQAYEQAVKQITRDVNVLVNSGDAYETIKATNSQDAVVALIEATYKEDGVLMSNEDAAQQVEDYLAEQAVSLASLKKIQARIAPKVEETPKQPLKQQPTTLTHQMSSGSASKAKNLRERAIAAFNGQLK